MEVKDSVYEKYMQSLLQKMYRMPNVQSLRQKMHRIHTVQSLLPKILGKRYWYVDGATTDGYIGNYELVGYDLLTGEELFHEKIEETATFSLAEFFAVIKALCYAQKNGLGGEIVIYTDALPAIKWVNDKDFKTALKSEHVETHNKIKQSKTFLQKCAVNFSLKHWDSNKFGIMPFSVDPKHKHAK